MHTFTHISPKLCLFLAILCLGSALHSEIVLHSALLRQGLGAVQSQNSPARLDWCIENNSTEDKSLTLQLKAKDRPPLAVYSQEVVIPARTVVYNSFDLMPEPALNYLMEVICDGACIAKDTLIAQQQNNGILSSISRNFSVAILHDPDATLGNILLAKNSKETIAPLSLTRFSPALSPLHWSSYHAFHALVMMEPQMSSLAIPQQTAILDYVKQGGNLVLASSKTSQSLQGTLLEELLPYECGDIYTYDTLASAVQAFRIQDWRPQPEFDEDGRPTSQPRLNLMNVTLHPHSASILYIANRPGVVVKKFGAGKVIAFTTDMFCLCDAEERFIPKIWNFIIAQTQYQNPFFLKDSSLAANEALQMLHGYAIPPVAAIVGILLVYVIGGAIIMVISIIKRRQGQGWLLLCAYALAVTLVIMCKANRISSAKDDCTIATLSLVPWDGTPHTVTSHTLFLGRKDIQPDVTLQTNETFIRIQPQTGNSLVNHSQSSGKTPLWVVSDNHETRLQRFNLQQNRPRPVFTLMRGQKHCQQFSCRLPELSYCANDIQFSPWPLLQELANCDRAMLLTAQGVQPLAIKNGMVCEQEGKSLVEADTVLTAIQNYIGTLNFKAPLLFLLQRTPVGISPALFAKNGSQSISEHHYLLYMVPVLLPDNQKPAVIPPEYISFRLPDKSSLKTAYLKGVWNNIPNRSLKNQYRFEIEFYIPAEMLSASPKAITVDTDFFSSVTSTAFNLSIVTADGKELMPDKHQGKTYVFNIGNNNPINPLTSSFLLDIHISNDERAQRAMGDAREQYWKINDIAVTVSNQETK